MVHLVEGGGLQSALKHSIQKDPKGQSSMHMVLVKRVCLGSEVWYGYPFTIEEHQCDSTLISKQRRTTSRVPCRVKAS